jgi:adenine-specific DNA-methyltransferase
MPTLNFKGKSYVKNHHLTVPYHQFVEHTSASLNPHPNLNDNLIIHGDNLKALKALLPIYANKIKCIYIDPPYNTGNENWIYNDNVNSPLIQAWLKENKPVDKEDLTRHDKWLCMMLPRLYLLKELLRDDGVIFVSIDDNEVHHLRLLMDEIFGSDNFVDTVIWEKKFAPQNDAIFLSDNHDYIVIYARNKEIWRPRLLPRTEEANARYKNPDNDPRGVWSPDNLLVKTYSANYDYPVIIPSGRSVKPADGGCWRVSKERFAELVADNRIWFGEDGNNVPRLKRFLSEVKQGLTSLTIWKREEVGDTQDARRMIREIFGDISVFDTPKSVELIKKILHLAIEPKEGDIILDSFAGSGTTGQAVLELNQEDGGNRKFILVEMEDYAESLTAERIKRIIQGVPNSRNPKLKEGLGGTFSFFSLGDEIGAEQILSGEKMPSYLDMARYVFYTATGEQFEPSKVNQADWYVGESSHYRLYLIYRAELSALRDPALALTADFVDKVTASSEKEVLIFAPEKFVETDYLDEKNARFVRLPHEVFRYQL